MDASLGYSRMHMIRNLMHLWFITKQNFSLPPLSVPYSSFRLVLLLQSTPVDHRRLMKAFISIVFVSLASLLQLKLEWIIRIYWFECWTDLSEISPVMRQFHASKGIVAFLAWPITSGNFVRMFCRLPRICVELLTLPCSILFFPLKTIISCVRFSVAVIIQCSVLCTLTFTWFHIIFIGFCPIINAIIITYIIRHYHCMNVLGIVYITSI